MLEVSGQHCLEEVREIPLIDEWDRFHEKGPKACFFKISIFLIF